MHDENDRDDRNVVGVVGLLHDGLAGRDTAWKHKDHGHHKEVTTCEDDSCQEADDDEGDRDEASDESEPQDEQDDVQPANIRIVNLENTAWNGVM